MKILTYIMLTIICLIASFRISQAEYMPYSYEWEKPVNLTTYDRAVIIARNMPHVIRMKNLIEEVGTNFHDSHPFEDEKAYKKGMIIYYAVIDEYARKLERNLSESTIYDLVEMILKGNGDVQFQRLLSILGDSEKCMSDEELKTNIKLKFLTKEPK